MRWSWAWRCKNVTALSYRPSSEENRRHFASVRALAEMIENNRKNEGQSK